MAMRWIRRRQHCRHLKSGQTVSVRASWAIYDEDVPRRDGRYQHNCPSCGTRIISVNMPNGGWAHFEAAKGLTRVKHPCLHRGEGMPRGRDALTMDLFESSYVPVSTYPPFP